MKRKLKSQIKEVKKTLKKEGKYQTYKNVFIHQQMRFLLTKINFIFNDNPNFNEIIDLELFLLNNFNNPQKWIDIMINLSQKWNHKWSQINWKSFALFLYFIYHYSLYYCKKTVVSKIYTQDNFIELNHQKIYYYNQWIKSMYKSYILDFNQYVIAVLRLVK